MAYLPLQLVLGLIVRGLEEDRARIVIPAKGKADIPDFLDIRLFRRSDDVAVFAVAGGSVAGAAGHEEEVFDIIESGIQGFRTIVVR